MKKNLVAAALAVALVIALGAPALAQIDHSATYKLDATSIGFRKQAGHWCNTGAEIKQIINGSGVLDKTQVISMSTGSISMNDINDGVAGATALTITTVWRLCDPPKYTYDAGLAVPYVPSADELYSLPYAQEPNKPWDSPEFGYIHNTPYDMADAYGFAALTDQIWAVQVQADPDFAINVHQDGASGFVMEQMAHTLQGTHRRHIDISNLFNHAYMYEDTVLVGRSRVKDIFAMHDLPNGEDIDDMWWY